MQHKDFYNKIYDKLRIDKYKLETTSIRKLTDKFYVRGQGHEFYCAPLLSSSTNPVNVVKTTGNVVNPREIGWKPREMQLKPGESRAYFASIYIK